MDLKLGFVCAIFLNFYLKKAKTTVTVVKSKYQAFSNDHFFPTATSGEFCDSIII